MMNLQNLEPIESLEVKYKGRICPKLRLKLWFKYGCCFYNITESGWFSKQLSWKKFLNNHFLKSILKSKYLKVQCRTRWHKQNNFTSLTRNWILLSMTFLQYFSYPNFFIFFFGIFSLYSKCKWGISRMWSFLYFIGIN